MAKKQRPTTAFKRKTHKFGIEQNEKRRENTTPKRHDEVALWHQ